MKYVKENRQIEVSVTELCALAYRGGDIDSRFSHSIRERAIEGMKVHKKLEGRDDLNFEAEVSLGYTTEYGGIKYAVSGRADGVLRTAGKMTVEEYKSVSPREFFAPPQPQHIAQLNCYALFLCEQYGLDGIMTKLVYVNSENEKIRSVDKYMTYFDLKAFFFALLQRVENRAAVLAERGEKLLLSMADAKFPYGNLREGQEKLIKDAYKAIIKEKKLFVQAPTGIGKTMSTVYPALKALSEGYCDKVFYLTAKASTRREAYNAAGRIFESGGHLRTVVLSAREQVCANGAAKLCGGSLSSHCNPEECEYAKGYYDRADAAIFELLSKQNGYSRTAIIEAARKYHICPYELALDLSEYCDLIVCDYNYVFDPFVYLRRYFDVPTQDQYVFLVDEAHNLADRARDMYSAGLSRKDFERIYSKIDKGKKNA